MTEGPRERKQMWVADVVLRRAARLVPVTLETPAVPTDLDAIDVSGARARNLSNLDRLAALGRERDLRGAFWRDLMRACEMLELPDRMVELTSHYRAALQRVGVPPTGEGIALGEVSTPDPKPAVLWLEFEHWTPSPDEDPAREFFNMTVTCTDGVRYALNVWTYGYFELARAEAISETNTLGGRFLEPPDLFVEVMNRALIEQVVATLIAQGRMRPEWRVPEEAPGDAG